MLKLLLVMPMLLVGVVLLAAGSLAFLPLLALLPVVLAAGVAVFAFVFALGLLGFLVRLVCALFVGLGALALGGIGLFAMLAGGAVLLAFGVLLTHLLLPILLIAGIVWLVHRAGRGAPPRAIAHG